MRVIHAQKEGILAFFSTLKHEKMPCYLVSLPLVAGLSIKMWYKKQQLRRVTYTDLDGTETDCTEKLKLFAPKRLISKGRVFGGFNVELITVEGILTINRHLFKGDLTSVQSAVYDSVTQKSRWNRRKKSLQFIAYSILGDYSNVSRLGRLDLLSGVPFNTPHYFPYFLCKDVSALCVQTILRKFIKFVSCTAPETFPYEIDHLLMADNNSMNQFLCDIRMVDGHIIVEP